MMLVIYLKKLIINNKDKALEIALMVHKSLHSDFNEKIITNYMLDCLKHKDFSRFRFFYNWPIHFYN